jgi:hypothetical protein
VSGKHPVRRIEECAFFACEDGKNQSISRAARID